MAYPIIKLNELTPSKYYQVLKTRLDALAPGEYRQLYNTARKEIIASIRQAGYTDEAPNPYDATPPAMGKIIERFNQLLTANGIDPQTGEIIEREN